MTKPSSDERKALGAFLASRRARLQPKEAGLSAGPRRTPGLRREEVAVLAGVSVSWYTWLEQGRDIQASAEMLKRLSQVLRLDAAEAAYLFALSAREPPSAAGGGEPSDGLLALVRAIDPIPARVQNARFDVLAWNAAMADLLVDYGALPPHERNTLRLLFLHRPFRTLVVDWERLARAALLGFRTARARATDKTPFDRLVTELREASEEFGAWWPDVGVESVEEEVKRLQHPTHGRIDFTYVAMAPEGRPDLLLVTYVPRTTDWESKS